MQDEIKTEPVKHVDANSADNTKALLDLIQGIQTKMNTNANNNNSGNNNSNNSSSNQETNENINLNNQETNNNTQNNDNSNVNNNTNTYQNNNTNSKPAFDLSSLSSLLGNVDISSILAGLGGGNSSSNNNNGFNLGDIDPNTINKFGRVIGSMNKDNPKKNLLLSLKPFLRKDRQDKLGEYVTMLSVVDAIDIFSSKGSD